MKADQNFLNEQRKFSAKNDRYRFSGLSKDQFYFPTETNLLHPNKRRITSTSFRKDKEQTGFPKVYTSGCPHNTANLYLNKKNFSFKKKSNKKGNNYFDKEKLYQNMVKLQISLNNMNMKYHKQKMENDKQAREIERQNKFLNSINGQNMRNWDLIESRMKNENNLNDNTEDMDNNNKNDDLMKNLVRSNDNSVELDFVRLDDKKFNLKSVNNNNKTFNNNQLKNLYEDLYQECKNKEILLIKLEKDKEKYVRENGILKVANETLISNLKLHMKKLEQENEQKDAKILELKKNLKCSRYTELLKENEILNKEMEKLKNKLKHAYALINNYKKQEEEIKKLYEVIKKRDFKIKALELELATLANNSDETTKKLQNELNEKEKLLKQRERDIKKSAFEKYSLNQGFNYSDRYSATDNGVENKKKKKELDIKTIYNRYPELYQLYIEMKHRDIVSSKNFSNDVLKKIKDTISIEDAKTKYISLLLGFFNISDNDENSKQIIIHLANREFVSNRSIFEIKKKQINILDTLFKKQKEPKSNDEIKSYVDNNNLEQLIKTTFEETDRKKFGYITFDEIKSAIKEMKLDEYSEEIMLITKSEIFNRFDYYNFLLLFNNEYIKSREENKTEGEKTEENNNINNDRNNIIGKKEEDNNDNNDNIEDNKKDTSEEKKEKKEEKNEQKEENLNGKNDNKKSEEKNNNNESENKEGAMIKNNDINDNQENKNNINNKKDVDQQNEDLEKKLKLIVHKIKTEGGTPTNYFSQLKETKKINQNDHEVININKLKEFLSTKNLELNEEEIKLLKKEFGFNIENNEEIDSDEYINYENFEQKLLTIIQNESDNDDNFMENIPKMDFVDE